MKAVILSLFALVFLNQSIHAQAPIYQLANQSVTVKYTSAIDEMVEIVNELLLQQDIAYPLGGVPVSDDCNKFINRDMIAGQLGQAIASTLMSNLQSFSQIIKGDSIANYCPQYNKMKFVQDKVKVWVLLLTMMAHYESSCNIASRAKGPNGAANGYFQLHLGKEQNYISKDLNNLKQFCPAFASTKHELSAQCTLAMIEFQLIRDKSLFNNTSYWEVLRPGGRSQKAGLIQTAIRRSSLCTPTKSTEI